MSWLHRRRKTLITAAHKLARCEFARRVRMLRMPTLEMWAYTDGTVFYVARTTVEKASTKRLALGPFVWRQTDGSDGLYEDRLGPSRYAKAQGMPIRVWGVLANGKLYTRVLPEGERMNGANYQQLARSTFGKWLKDASGWCTDGL